MSERAAASVLEFDPSKLGPDGKELYERLSAKRAARGQTFGGPYLALLNDPPLAELVESLGFHLKFEGSLPRDVYQFVVLTVAHASGSAFEWHDHLRHALAQGVPQTVVDAIVSGSADALPLQYRLAYAILQRTIRWQLVPLDEQQQAVSMWGRVGLVEIVVLSGFYQMFAAINGGFAIAPPGPAG